MATGFEFGYAVTSLYFSKYFINCLLWIFLLDIILDALLTHMSVNKVAADRELKFALKI